jgi:uncharacterized membrane protein YdjX (TVP38/TMEM64 family)
MRQGSAALLHRASGTLSVGIEAQKKSCTILDVLSFAFFVLIVGGALVTAIVPSSRDALFEFVQWARTNTTEGVAAYTFFFAIGAVVCFPEVMLAAVAGYIFPLGWAAFSVWIGSLIGSGIAFQLGRLLFKEKIRSCVHKRGPSTLRKLDAAFVEEGWKMVLIIRLPYIPLVWVNYVLCATSTCTPHARPHCPTFRTGSHPSPIRTRSSRPVRHVHGSHCARHRSRVVLLHLPRLRNRQH